MLDHTGLGRSKSADAFAEYDLVLTTYGTLRRDVMMFKDFTFDYCILDESQAVKRCGGIDTIVSTTSPSGHNETDSFIVADG